MSEILKAPFPWFGGKRRVAHIAWRAFGDVPNYVEPFAGSLAVMLGRPTVGKIETVNDVDRMLANFWRAIAGAPLEVARWADWPVNEADLHARHVWLVQHLREGAEFRERMHSDADFYDAKIAGWWVWGICQWIGAGWCVEPKNRKHPKLDGIGKGVHSNTGHGELRLKQQMPKLSVTDGATGIGGVHAQGLHLPALGNDRGLNGVSAPPCADWFVALQERLRRVRVACGDWTRVLGPSVLGKGKNVGGRRPCAVFLDPPYAHDRRATQLYADDDASISANARAWAIANGNDPDLRIALCGYEGEHEMPSSWTVHSWTAARGYAKAENNNRELERIWFSPHCLPIDDAQPSLFGRSA